MTWHLPWGIVCGAIQGFVASFARAKVLQHLLIGIVPREPGQPSVYTNTELTLLIVAFAATIFFEGNAEGLAHSSSRQNAALGEQHTAFFFLAPSFNATLFHSFFS